MLKFSLNSITDEDLEKAKKEVGSSQRYSGPIAPAGRYNVVLDGLWAGETRAGDGKIVAAMKIKETGDNATYNGCPVWRHLVVPSSPKDENFAIRIKSLDDLFRAASGEKINVNDFVDAMNNDRVKVGKEDKVGEPIQQIGKFKSDQSSEFTVVLKDPETYNGRTNATFHYIDAGNPVKKEEEPEPDVDDDDLDDIDDLLGDLDD